MANVSVQFSHLLGKNVRQALEVKQVVVTPTKRGGLYAWFEIREESEFNDTLIKWFATQCEQLDLKGAVRVSEREDGRLYLGLTSFAHVAR
jgi:hypothetical protein